MVKAEQSLWDRYLFFADAMVQKLGRFLRVLGFDTLIANSQWTDTFILAELQSTSRILLTRDAQLADRARVRRSPIIDSQNQGMDLVLYLSSEDLEQQIVSVLHYIHITPQIFLEMHQNNTLQTRCSKCNSELRQVSKETIIDRIPPKTAARYDQYWECSNCHQVYWFGSHWKDIVETLDRVNALWISNC